MVYLMLPLSNYIRLDPDEMSIKSQNIGISSVPGIDMLRKRDFLNISRRLCPDRFRADDLNITRRKKFIAGGAASTVLGAEGESIL